MMRPEVSSTSEFEQTFNTLHAALSDTERRFWVREIMPSSTDDIASKARVPLVEVHEEIAPYVSERHWFSNSANYVYMVATDAAVERRKIEKNLHHANYFDHGSVFWLYKKFQAAASSPQELAYVTRFLVGNVSCMSSQVQRPKFTFTLHSILARSISFINQAEESGGIKPVLDALGRQTDHTDREFSYIQRQLGAGLGKILRRTTIGYETSQDIRALDRTKVDMAAQLYDQAGLFTDEIKRQYGIISV